MAAQLCTTLVFTSALALIGGAAQAQDYVEALKAHLATDQSPLLAPAQFEDMRVSAIDGGSRIELVSVDYAGQALDALGFDVTPIGDGSTVQVSNVDLPNTLTFDLGEGTQTLSWANMGATGVYDTATGAYESLNLSGNQVTLVSDDASINIEFDSLGSTSTFTTAEGSFTGEIQGSGLTVRLEDAELQMTISVPEGWMRTTASGYATDQNPMAALGQQIQMTLQPLFDPEAQLSALADLPIAQSYTQTASLAPSTLTFTGIDTATVELGTMSLAASFTDMNVPNAAAGQMSYFVDGVQVRDPASGSDVRLESLGLSVVMDEADYTSGASLNSYELYSEEPGTYAPIADVLEAAGKASAQFTARGLSFAAPNDGLDFTADRIDWRFGSDTRSPDGNLGIATLVEGLRIDGFGGSFIAGLMPKVLELSIDMDKLDMPALAEIMRGAVRSGSIAEIGVTDRDVEAMMPALIDWWLTTRAELAPNLKLATDLTTLSASGTLPFDSEAAYGLTGNLDIIIADYDAFVDRVNEAVGSDNLEDQQLSLTLAQGLGFLGIFGEKLEDGSLKLEAMIDKSGAISVNGIPLPF